MKRLILAAALLLLATGASAQTPTLTAAETADGWKLMFDGKSLAGWRGYKTEKPSDGWRPDDGLLVRLGGGGDLMTVEEYGDFDMRFEWKITEYGNSGVIYRIGTTEPYPWHTGPEYQVLDNGRHPDGKSPLTSSGSNYAVDPPIKDVTKPVGQWNEGRIVAKGNHVEHWLNGIKVLEYERGSKEFKDLVKVSKYVIWKNFGEAKQGHILLQDHGFEVNYKNIKIKELH